MTTQPTQARCQRWESVKSDVHQIYIVQKKTLEATRTAIKARHGFEQSTRSWKKKFEEWGYSKYIKTKGKKRELEGKDMDFRHVNNPIAPQRNQNFKRRKLRELSPSAATPPDIWHDTLNVSFEETFREEISLDSVACHSSLFQVSSLPLDEANSIASSSSTKEGPLTALAGVADVPATSMLEPCPSGELGPWSVFNLRSQLGDHDFVSPDGLQQLGCLGGIFDELDSSLDLCCYENHFLLDTESTYSELLPRRNFTELVPIPDCASSYSAIHNDHEDYTDEMIALRDMFDLTVKLAEYQYYQAKVAKHGESSQQILKKEFELAKAAERCGESGKAEYHCRRILHQSPVIDVQTFLGMILAHSARPEESIFPLFSALAEFIIQFDISPLETNIRLWKPIEYLFCELLPLTEQNWDSLVSGFFKMKDTFKKVVSEVPMNQIFPELVVNGFSFAHGCSTLGYIDSAKYMYQRLLKYCPTGLDTIYPGFEKAKAHQKYGLLLREEEQWTSGAQQLLLACQSALNSGTPDSRLIAILHCDYADFLPHLTTETNSAIAGRIGTILSSESPLPNILYAGQKELPLRAIRSARSDCALTSTGSISTSETNSIGKTFTSGSGATNGIIYSRSYLINLSA